MRRPHGTPTGRPITVCHRGARVLAPENTLRAFELTIAAGIDMAELDVHLSADGELVVLHDSDLQRVAGRPATVAETTADELGRLDLGEGQGVPRLVDVLALARGRLGLYVELKGPGTGRALGELVRSGAAAGVDLIAGSFEPALVVELRAADPTVPRSVLFRPTTLEDMVAVGRAVGADYAHPCFRRSDGQLRPPIDRALVDALHAAGLTVMTPHTNDAAEAAAFAAIGVDVIASDDPRVLTQFLTAPRPSQPSGETPVTPDRGPVILHIAASEDWRAAQATGSYTADTLATEGFIHCSTPDQVLTPANALFRGRLDLLLLVIDPARVGPEIKYEGMPGGEQFPHVYGPLNLDAVLRVLPFPAGADGSFTLPREL